MTNDELFSQLLDKISSFDYIHADQIPNIDLYMDQVTTFMDTHLGATRRYDEDKVLTKTMINNYAKNNLLPSPVRKKYTENHILQLILIYYMKSFLSISDIETMLKPLTQHFWDENSSPNFAEIYSRFFHTQIMASNRLQTIFAINLRLQRKLFPAMMMSKILTCSYLRFCA